MILGIGIDLTDITRIARIYKKFGNKLLHRLLTPVEIAGLPIQATTYIASRFAAKEAAVKALGTGFTGGITPVQIEVTANSEGMPLLTFYAQAEARAKKLGINKKHLSISHERNCAAAIVVLED